MEVDFEVAAETFLKHLDATSWLTVSKKFDNKSPLYIYDASEAHHKLLKACADILVDLATKKLES